MLITASGRPIRMVKNVRGGDGELQMHDLATPETLPKNIRILSFLTLKPGESVGYHSHADEDEVYHCISGQGWVRDGSEEVEMAPGDTVVLPAGTMHGMKNLGLEDLVVLALVVHD